METPKTITDNLKRSMQRQKAKRIDEIINIYLTEGVPAFMDSVVYILEQYLDEESDVEIFTRLKEAREAKKNKNKR